MKNTLLMLLLLAVVSSSCVGVRQNGESFTAHAESFRLLGLTIPRDERAAALEKVPEGAEVTTMTSTPSDWDSVFGVLNNLFGFGVTEVSWIERTPSRE